MAGKDFDPLDIQSEMGGMSVFSPDFTTPREPSVEEMFKLVAIAKNPTPLETIAPGEPGNELDVENPPDFDTLNRAFPVPPPLRRSKKQAGYDPDFLELKKFIVSSSTENILDPDFSSEDVSGDEDFELVARPKVPIKAGQVSGVQNTIEDDNNTENKEYFAEFLSQLRSEKKATPVAQKSSADEEPDTEILEEFEENRPDPSESSSSKSSSESEEYSVENEVEDGDRAESEVVGTEPDVVNIENTIDMEDYDMGKSFSAKFYSKDALVLWLLYNQRGMIEEKKIDEEAYDRQNLISFLKIKGSLSPVTSIQLYCRQAVLEFYCNLLSSVGDVQSAKFCKVFVRNRIYSFNPSIITTFFGTTDEEESDNSPDIDMITLTLTGGLIKTFPEHPKKLAAANLTPFYSVLHKTPIQDWIISNNTTVVTRSQALVLFAIGTGRQLNFGKLVFETVLQFVEGASKGTKLLFSSLIYRI